MKALCPLTQDNIEYLTLLLSNSNAQIKPLIEESAHGTKCLRSDLLKNVALPIPPMADQTSILQTIDVSTTNIDQTILRTQREISLLEEYRTRLIADVVTGKIDVRDITVPDVSSTGEPPVEELDFEATESEEEAEDTADSLEFEE